MLPALCVLLSLGQPIPVAYWEMQESRIRDGQLWAAQGPSMMVSGYPTATTIDGVPGLRLPARGDAFTYWWEQRSRWPEMPKRDFTVSVGFAAHDLKGVKGVLGCMFEPDEGLTGWRILLRNGKVEFTLADHDGKSPGGEVTLTDSQPISPDHVHQVNASYDGRQVTLYVDGQAKASAPASFGDITYNGRAGICAGDWWEGPRSFEFQGVYTSVALFDRALTPDVVDASLKAVRPVPLPEPTPRPLAAVVEPYFQYPTTDSATVMWETTAPSSSRVYVGESAATAKPVTGSPARLHEVRLTGLKPGTVYFVKVESDSDLGKYASGWQSFRTASPPGHPVKFAIVGDTQDHPEVNHRIAEGMFAAQPDFAVVVGDLVGCGWIKVQWTHDFWASMRPLFSYVPLLPVMGNHDRNARLYYDYMSVPTPEYAYTYVSGDVQLWVVDTEHDVQPGSPQYRWLEASLRKSKARWKIVAHHYPPYSSDQDDFGDSASGPTEGGDDTARQLCPLYDRYHVDLCFSGHIHSYERSRPIRGGKVAADGRGTIYMVVGGGGGDTETFTPTHRDSSHTVRTGHHYGVVWADANRLEFRAYDIDQRLFDAFELKK